MINEQLFREQISALAGKCGQPVLVAYSGGGDSTALLHLLRDAGVRGIIACHLHHGLRGEEADRDADFCREVAEEMGVTFEMQRADVAARALKDKHSLETAGRQARHQFFADMSRKHRATHLCLAHHADDQAETVLQHLLRGSGTQGLRGMAASSCLRVDGVDLQLHRPLLDYTHRELLELNARNGWKYLEDSTNAELSNRRNRIRHQIIPVLSELGYGDVVKTLGRTADLAREDHACLQNLAEEVLAQCRDPRDHTRLRWKILAEQPLALQRRAVRQWLQEAAVPDLGFHDIEGVRSLLTTNANAPARVNLPGNWQAGRKNGQLYLRKLL